MSEGQSPGHRSKSGVRARRDREHREAHLVGRALAPEDVARRELRRADDRLPGLRVVVRAADPHRVAGTDLDRRLQVVDVLPVEVPRRDVQQRLLLRRPRVEHDGDVLAAQVHVARRRRRSSARSRTVRSHDVGMRVPAPTSCG